MIMLLKRWRNLIGVEYPSKTFQRRALTRLLDDMMSIAIISSVGLTDLNCCHVSAGLIPRNARYRNAPLSSKLSRRRKDLRRDSLARGTRISSRCVSAELKDFMV